MQVIGIWNSDCVYCRVSEESQGKESPVVLLAICNLIIETQFQEGGDSIVIDGKRLLQGNSIF